MVTAQPGRYVGALDGLRGLAALIVVVAHTSGGLVMPLARRKEIFQGPLGPLLNADGAVQLFFVLSGYVLTGSLLRNRGASDLAAYGVKRVFRIHPPYVAAVLVAWGASFLYVFSWHVSPWLRKLSAIHLDPGQLLLTLRFPGNAFRQLPVGWSLEVEMIFSFLLPVMLWIALRTHWLAVAALCVPSLFLTITWTYSIDFAMGMAAYLERERLSRWVGRMPTAAAAALFVASLALWSGPAVLGWRSAGTATGDPASIPVHALGALGFVVLAVHRPGFGRALAAKPLAWLGRVSYSLYLLHFPLLLVLAPRIGGPASWSVGVTLYVAVVGSSLVAAELGYRLVEIPSIRLGNRICRWLAARGGSGGVASARADAG